MSNEALNWAFATRCHSAGAKLVLVALADKANDDSQCWPSTGWLGERVDLSPRQVQRHLDALEAQGALARERRVKGNGQFAGYTYTLSVGSACPAVIDDQRTSTSDGHAGFDQTTSTTVTSGHVRPVDHTTPVSPLDTSEDLDPSTDPSEEPSTVVAVVDDHEPATRRLCALLADLVEANGSKRPKVTDKWLTECDRLQRLDGKDPGEIERCIRWTQNDSFWRANVLSMPTLRARYDRLRLTAERNRPAALDAMAIYAREHDIDLGANV